MKTLRLPVLFALVIAGCDKLENPVIVLNNQYLEGVYGPAPAFSTLNNPTKNVLVEEFTGHLCGFCPPATALVKSLDEDLGELIVPVSIHAGTLAEVGAAPFETDYTTPEGDAFWAQLENGFQPCARIDRLGGTSNFFVDNQWAAKINQQLEAQPEVAMQMITDYVPEDNNLNIHVHSQFLTNLQGSYQLIVLLLESHLISGQEDYDLDPTEIPDYEHNHVLRKGVTSSQGEPLIRDPRNSDQLVKSYTLPMSSSWIPGNCTVVAYILSNETGQVINAVENHVTE
jgi:hypothetical protein